MITKIKQKFFIFINYIKKLLTLNIQLSILDARITESNNQINELGERINILIKLINILNMYAIQYKLNDTHIIIFSVLSMNQLAYINEQCGISDIKSLHHNKMIIQIKPLKF